MGFLAVREEFATVWRGDVESPLSAVSPFPLALTAIEVMRPHCYAYFVPFAHAAHAPRAGPAAAVGDAFFRALATGLATPGGPVSVQDQPGGDRSFTRVSGGSGPR